MKTINQLIGASLIFLALVFSISCNQSNKTEHEAEHEHSESEEHEHMDSEDHDHAEGEMDHDHDHEKMDSMGDGMSWKPEGEAKNFMQNDFHFISGGLDEMTISSLNEEGDEVLSVNPDGNVSAFVFHKSEGNIGITASVKVVDYNGELKLIHHSKNADNYEFVSLSEKKMELGRVVDGVKKVFDSKVVDWEPKKWITLSVTAAGSHFKGYLNDKMITHGHGDELEKGYVGIMLNGTGTVLIKEIDITPLEAEH